MMRANTAEFFCSNSFPVGFIMLFMSKGLPLKKVIVKTSVKESRKILLAMGKESLYLCVVTNKIGSDQKNCDLHIL